MRALYPCCLLIAAAGCSPTPPGAAPLPVEMPPVTESRSDSAAAPATAAARPVAEIERAVIISIDGLRPDLLLRASMPRVRGLCEAGSFTFWAETVPEAYTLPSHVSMLTGCDVAKHGVSWNDYIEESYPNVPTLFEVAKRAGYSTALVAGKMKFITFTKPGALDWSYLPADEPVADQEVAAQAERLLRERRPEVLMVHLPGVDTVGHESGWGSPEQIAAIELADQAVGLILNVIAALNLTESTLIIVTADHGGSGKDHGESDPRSRFIPWIISGPGVRPGFDLTLLDKRRIRTEDTFATVCAFLAIPPGDTCDGQPVLEALASKNHK
jgi:predicted AlkP superfamily pyrophosphatase or phosphodiesterase